MSSTEAKPSLTSRALGCLCAPLYRLLLSDRAFLFCQKHGVHITPNNYEQPVPDTTRLRDGLWSAPSELPGIDMNEAKQVELLTLFQMGFRQEYESFPPQQTGNPHDFYLDNVAFRSVDAEVLYCMVRHFKPRRIYEIGSGMSTLLSARAALRNEQDGSPPCELVAIEPYPNALLRGGFPGLTRLVQSQVEDIPLREFSHLSENDILFIDSSHVLRTGNDVQYEYLELLPRLNGGVIVHVHDIFLPAEYPRQWVTGLRRFWTEQYLLQAFLAFNHSFEVLWGGGYMHLAHPDRLQAAFASYDRNTVNPGSLWMRRTR